MPNLTGYDLIIEVARAAIERELLNTPLPSGPNGPVNDTLVPPFQLSRNVPLPGLTGLLTLKVTELSLHAQARTSLLTLHLSFEEGSLEAPGIAVALLAGQGTVTAALYFTPPAPQVGSPLPVSNLVLDFTQATSTFQLDQASSDRLDQAGGATLGGAIRSALGTALTALFKTQGVVNLNFSFAVDSGHDSTNMMVLTAVPNLSWIDGESLGIFGYHRQGANTGNTAWKINSDLPPAPYPGFPWYPVAVLVSPSSFQQLVACPAIRSAARDHVSGRHRDDWINEERARNHNEGPATAGEIAAADNRLRLYLDAPEGQAEIAGATPSPCGHGQIDQHIKMPDPFSDTTGYIDWLSMDLGNGQIDLKAHAHANVFCGSVSVDVPMSLRPFVGADNSIQPGQIKKGEPSSNVDANVLCELAIAAMSAFLIGPLIGSVIAIIGVTVAESLAEGLLNSEILKQDLPTPKMGGSGPKLPPNVRLRELFVAPSGLTIQGVWDGLVNDPHKFDPSVHLYGDATHAKSHSIFTLPGTFEASCGGDPRTFTYTPHAWVTTEKYRLEIGDVPHPLRFDDWWLWNDGVAHRLAPGTLTFPGQVVVPEPPDKETLQRRDEIVIDVQGSNDKGYTLTFRAEDANVPFKVYTRVIDGSGRSWWLGTDFGESQGITFEFDKEYIQFREECARFMNGVVNGYKLYKEVPVWDKVATFEHVVQERLRGVTHDRVLGAAAAVRQLMIEQPGIARQLFRQE